MLFEFLPVELIADILGELDLKSLITMSYLSKRLRLIAADSSLNPWRRPILRALHANVYEDSLKHLSVRSTVPRQNWIEILSMAHASFILFEATLPNLGSGDWEECFKRRFLPGWRKWKKDSPWKEAFLKMLHRSWHRSVTTCTSDEAWTKYIVLNRNGSVNELEVSSRNFNPLVLFNEMKLQSNLAHLETRVRLVVEFADVRILAFGVLNRPTSALTVNPNAHIFLHPPGIEVDVEHHSDRMAPARSDNVIVDHGVYPVLPSSSTPFLQASNGPTTAYTKLKYPLPAQIHENYPLYTPSGSDKRWLGSGDVEEEGLHWVGGLMIIAQILCPHTHDLSGDWPPLQDLDLVVGPGRGQYASFTWLDLLSIAPWVEERVTKKIDGPGLGI